MEELRSTDVLDQEIRADARKRAERILAKAEESAQSLLDGVQERLSGAEQNAREAADARCSLFKKNSDAALPLERQRHQVSFIHGAVVDTLNACLERMDEADRLRIVQRQLERALPQLGTERVEAVVIGFSVAAAKKLLSTELGARLASCEKGPESLIAGEAVPGIARREGLLLKTADGRISCRLTIDEKVKEMLDNNTDELALALFGGRLPA